MKSFFKFCDDWTPLDVQYISLMAAAAMLIYYETLNECMIIFFSVEI